MIFLADKIKKFSHVYVFLIDDILYDATAFHSLNCCYKY